METVAEKPAYRKAFATRRALLPADGYFEWYPTSQTNAKGKPVKQPFFIRPKDGGVLAMAGLYEIWRDPTKGEDDPDRFRWTCTVLTTAGRGLARPHPRPDAADGRARALARVARPDARPATPRSSCPAAPGRLEAYAVPTLVSNVRNNGPELVEPLPLEDDDVKKASVRTVDTPHGEGRLHTRRATSPIATLLLSHGAGGGVESRDLWALADALPAQGVSVVLFEQPWRVAGRKVATAPPTLDVGADPCAADVMRVRTPLVVGGRSAGARSAARTARALGASGCLALSFPLHQPGKTEPTRLAELPRRRACRPSSCRGSATRWAGPRSSPATSTASTWWSSPAATTGSRCPRGARSARTRRWASSSSRRWSGWSARSSGIPGRGEVLGGVQSLTLDRPTPLEAQLVTCATAVLWEAMTESLTDEMSATCTRSPSRTRPPTSGPRASSVTPFPSSTSSTARRCG